MVFVKSKGRASKKEKMENRRVFLLLLVFIPSAWKSSVGSAMAGKSLRSAHPIMRIIVRGLPVTAVANGSNRRARKPSLVIALHNWLVM